MSATDFSQPMEVKAFAAMSAGGNFQPYTFQRRGCGPNDVVIDIEYAGMW
jgi:D-arabinose 1-dehydrogenase-like Zn-dependent alcohol dehydrogenase